MIKLVKANNCWAVDYSESLEREEVESLFGTTVLPTPYLLSANPDAVRDELQQRHAELIVIA